MDEQTGDRRDPAPDDSSRDGTSERVDDVEMVEFEWRLRSTERVRTVIRRSCTRCSAPETLIVRIRESLVVFRE